ncbi:unnamed protein product [Meganyctiphanes norvegica]|uniref:N-acetyltransferase domain-containing protein n=1 Tax=Meganyctiphanes norvegica TaxID=48144 RepID=A0AAV2RFC5_MEGNR
MEQFLYMEDIIEKSFNLWANDGVTKVLEMVILVVHQNYCRRGIAKKLVQLSEETACKLDCQQVMSQASNVVSQGLFHRMDYKTVADLSMDSFKMEGKSILNMNEAQGTSKYLFMIKQINKNNYKNNVFDG